MSSDSRDRGEAVLLAVTASAPAARMLSRYVQGCRTVVLQDLQQARHAAQKLMPQVVLVDADCASHEAISKLGQEWQLPNTLFIRCPLPGEGIRQHQAMVNGYLIKPILQQNLWDTLRRFGEHVDKVLVVDDDQDFVRLLARLLDSPVRRYQVVRAYNGREALEVLRYHDLDLAMVDIRLPDIDGFQLIDKMRADPAWRDIPIVVLSGQDEADSFEVLRGEITFGKAEGFTPADIIGWIQSALASGTRTSFPIQQPTAEQLQGAETTTPFEHQ